jgi:hypothetical protein
MRDVLAAVLMLGAVGAGGYAVWLAVQARRGAPRREGVPRARTLALGALLTLILAGAVAPANDNGKKDRATSEAVAADAADTVTTEDVTATTATTDTTEAAAVVAADEADRREKARTARAAKRVKARAARVRAERRAAKRKAARVRARKAARVRAQLAARARVRKAAEARRQAALDAAAAAPAADDSAQYAGMNCTEIGHSFNVTPGSDPVHDRDNDGLACESQ